MNKRAAAGVAAVVVAAGIGTRASFRADELIHSADYLAAHTQYAPVRAAEGRTLAELESFERMSAADALRARIIRLPVAVKGTLLLPLWALGALPMALGTALSPLWGALLGLAVQVGLLLGLFCLVYKLLFPKKKLRELLRRRNLKWLFVGAVTVTAANAALTQLWTGWPVLRAAALSLVGLGVLCLLWKRLCGAFKAPEPETVRTRLVMDW